MSILIGRDLKTGNEKTILEAEIDRYVVQKAQVYYMTEEDQTSVYKMIPTGEVEQMSFKTYLNPGKRIDGIAASDDYLFINSDESLLCYSFEKGYMEKMMYPPSFEFITYQNRLYFTDLKSNNLYTLDADLKKNKLNDLYCTYLTCANDQVYFANWKDHGRMYCSDLIEKTCIKITDEIITDCAAGDHKIFYLSEDEEYRLCICNPSGKDRIVTDFYPLEIACWHDRLYYTQIGQRGIFCLDEEMHITKVSEQEAHDLKIDGDVLYFINGTSSEGRE